MTEDPSIAAWQHELAASGQAANQCPHCGSYRYGEPTPVDDLIAQIRAAIDEDERMAEAAFEQARHGEWEYRPGSDDGVYAAGGAIEVFRSDAYGYTRLGNAYGQHIARHDPARVLRQAAAHRTILEIHSGPHSCGFSDYDDADPCGTLLAFAEAYGIEVHHV